MKIVDGLLVIDFKLSDIIARVIENLDAIGIDQFHISI